MAKESRRKKSTNQLTAEIARSRDFVERDLRDLRAELDFPRKIRKSFRRSTGIWIAAVVVVGVALAVRPRGRKKVYVNADNGRKSQGKLVEAGFALGALRIAATLLKPVILKFVTSKLAGYASGAQTRPKW